MKTERISLAVLLLCGSLHAANRFVDPAAPDSADTGSGGLRNPFHSLSRASAVLGPGDTCFLRTGTYRETLRPTASGTVSAPVVYAAFPAEVPVITGTDSVRGKWKSMGKGLYRINLTVQVTEVYQAFVDGTPAAENTWPKLEARFSTTQFREVLKVAKISPSRWCLEDPAIPRIATDGYWRGASIWLLPGVKTSAHFLPIDEHRKKRLCFNHFSDHPAYFPDRTGGRASYFAIVKRSSDTALLEKGQWSFDPAAHALTMRFAKGDDPARHRIEIRTRLLGLDLSHAFALRHIALSGVDFFAASLDFANAESSSVSRAGIRYVTPFFLKSPPPDRILRSLNMSQGRWRGVNLSGSANVLRGCRLDGSWADGVSISGSANTADNNRIVNTNWIGGDFAGISMWDSLHQATRNSVGATGRSGLIHVDAAACRIAYNRIEEFGKLTDDFGGIYTAATDGKGTEIIHNRIGPASAQDGKYPGEPRDFRAKMAGIYIDIADSNFIIRANTIRLGQSGYSLRLNGPQRNIVIRDNALLDVWGAIASINCGNGTMRAIRLADNLMPGGFEPSDAGCGMEWTKDIDAEGNSLQALESSPWEAETKDGADQAL